MRLVFVLGGAAALAVSGTMVARAQEAQTGDAPPGKAEAVAVQVEGVAAAGHSKAEAGPQGGQATGNAVELGGEPPSEEFGGTQQGEGRSEGSLIDTGENELGRVQVTPWSAEVSEDENGTTARGAAAVLRLALGDNLVALAVLQSESEATHRGPSSTGSSSSDGARADVGGDDGLSVTVLHAETTSEGEGESYLVGIQDEKLFTSDDANGQCRVEIPSVAGLACLSASGGEAGEPVTASVADVTVGGEEDGLAGQIVGAQGSGTQTGTAVLGGAQEAPEPAPAAGPDPERGALAATGGALAASTAAGLALLFGGIAAHELRRRTTR